MKKVLVVDDSPIVRSEVSEFLTTHEITAETAEDGLEAIQVLEKDPDGFGLIIADINMPNVDGFAFVERLRENEALKSMKVIMLTTECDQEMKDRGKNMGVLGWIVKPFNGEKVINSVKKLLNA